MKDGMIEDISLGIALVAMLALGIVIGLAFRWPSGL
jgi:hypothetical protein